MPQKRPDRALGPSHDAFWNWCGKGELRLQVCDACSHHNWPARDTCERCGSDTLSWRRISGQGKIVSWCIFERDYYDGCLPLPWDTILVELEEGPLFVSNPDGFTADAMSVGMPVTVRFIECEDSAGAFNLPVFVAD